jgi:predicted permease
VLAVFGGAAGSFLAELGVRLFVTVAPANIPRLQEVHVDWPVLLFAAGLSVITAILFGTLPALRSLRVQPQQAMQNTMARAANPREGVITRNLLVAAEVAFTVVLLIVAALVIRSFARVLNQERGFDSSHVLVAQVDLFSPQYGQSQPNFRAAQIAFIERALDRLRQVPGVQSVAMTSVMPLTGDYWVDGIVRPDHPLPPAQEPKVNIRWVSPDYFSLMRVPVIAGRSLTLADKDHPDRAVISQAAARAAWPGEDPIGKQFNDPTGQGKITVVGVVADTRTNGLKEVSSMVYLPFWNFPPWQVSFLVRSSLPAATLAPAMRREIWNVDPEVAIPTLKSMDDQISDSVALERFQTLLLSSFGVAALLLSLLGIYGVLSYSVQLRQQEMGIRIALGADRSNLVQLVMRQAACPVAGGLFAGLALAMLATRAVESLLYETKPGDPLAMLASCTLLLLTAFFAVLIPAFRAANADPARMLRAE